MNFFLPLVATLWTPYTTPVVLPAFVDRILWPPCHCSLPESCRSPYEKEINYQVQVRSWLFWGRSLGLNVDLSVFWETRACVSTRRTNTFVKKVGLGRVHVVIGNRWISTINDFYIRNQLIANLPFHVTETLIYSQVDVFTKNNAGLR